MSEAQPVSLPEPLPISLDIQVSLEVVRQTFTPNRKQTVPIGSIYVLVHGHEISDESGLPEVYLAGEEIPAASRLERTPYRVVELAEFPGRISFRLARLLAGISQTQQDEAVIEAHFPVRLDDPSLALRHGGWKERGKFNENLEGDLRDYLENLLQRERLQLWSGDDSYVFGRIFADLDDYLRRYGLRVDTTNPEATVPSIIAVRRYPRFLYEMALRIADAERDIRYRIGEHDIFGLRGLGSNVIRAIDASQERDGVALWNTLIRSPEKDQMITWMQEHGFEAVASFIRRLYDKTTYNLQDIKLSEQILLAAIQNPMLTLGEWLQQEHIPYSRFQQIETLLRTQD
jgi:arsenate reductase-like glutaredoxin family protein